MAKTKQKTKIQSIEKDVEQLELLHIAGSSIKWIKHFGKQVDSF